MELFGIIFSLPVVFALTLLYSHFINKILGPTNPARGIVFKISVFIVVYQLSEVTLFYFFNGFIMKYINMDLFYDIHLLFFFFALAGFINIIKIKLEALDKWYIMAPASTLFWLMILFSHIYIVEFLYGIGE